MIESGLSSELFLLAFLIPDSGYRLAQRLQNTKSTPNTSKIYPNLNKLVASGYLIKKDNKFVHNPDRLVEDIAVYLESKGHDITNDEIKIIRNILTNGTFFNILSVDIITYMQQRPTRIHEINALEVFCNKIGMLASLTWVRKMNKPEPMFTTAILGQSFDKFHQDLTESTDEIMDNMYPKIRGSKSIKEKKMDGIELINETMKSMLMIGFILEKIPERTIKKFCLLWDQFSGFRSGVIFSSIVNRKIDMKNFTSEISKIQQEFGIF
ncbi:MAG: hypothetical protein ACREBB_06175 [Nitrosotalea sp.]